MDIARLVDTLEEAIGESTDVRTIERVAMAILKQQIATSAGLRGDRHSSSPSRKVDYPSDVFESLIIGISLRDCSSPLPATVRARAYDKIRRVGARFVDTAEVLFREYGLQTPPLLLSVSPVSCFVSFDSVTDYVELATVLDRAAVDVGVAAINGYTLFVGSNLSACERHFVESILSVMVSTSRLFSSVSLSPSAVPTTLEGIDRLAEAIAHLLARSDNPQSSALDRLTILVNGCDRDSSLLNYFYANGEADVTANAVPSMERAFSDKRRFGDFDFSSVANSIFRTATTIVQLQNQIERSLASKLASASGIRIISRSESKLDLNSSNSVVSPSAVLAAGRTAIPIPRNPSAQTVAEKLSAFCAQESSLREPSAGVLTFVS